MKPYHHLHLLLLTHLNKPSQIQSIAMSFNIKRTKLITIFYDNKLKYNYYFY